MAARGRDSLPPPQPAPDTSGMSVAARILDALWPGHRVTRDALAGADLAAGYAANVIPPAREARAVTMQDAVTIPAVYRALHLLTTAAAQLPLNAERNGRVMSDPPALVRRPSLNMSRSDFIEQLTLSLAVTGNAYLRRVISNGETIALDVLNPHYVTPKQDPKTERVTYGYKGKDYRAHEIEHLRLMQLPGQLRGIGPIQAAQASLRGTMDMRDHMSRWFNESGQPAGILTSDQELTADQARRYRNAWNYLDADGEPVEPGDNPSRIRVLGKGTKYEPILISPKDALWLEAQSFSTLEVARLFGAPSSLMYAAIDGNSQTYSNVEQEWLAFTRFTLMAYLRKIEEALTSVAPTGITVRFNLEALLRSDTKTRFEGYEIGLRAGFLTVSEVRAIEGMSPLTTPAPVSQENPA